MIAIVVGTRPEITKMAPIVWELQRRRAEFTLIHTGQHYDYNMSKVFFEELEIRKPDVFLGVGSGTREKQLALIEEGLGKAIAENGITTVCVQGDTNSVFGSARAAKKHGCILAHVESGARSFVKGMPEEKNRIKTDRLSDVLFAPTPNCLKNLRSEGLAQKEKNGKKREIFLSGNTELETLAFALKKKRPPAFASRLPSRFAIATIHRQSNANPRKLAEAWKLFAPLGMRVLFLCHPRTEKVLRESGLWQKAPSNVILEKPVGYFELLWLLEKSSAVFTDSGGLQVESAALGKPLLILRNETEWVEVIKGKAGILLSLDDGRKAEAKVEKFLKNFKPKKGIFKGGASKLIVSKLLEIDSAGSGRKN